MLALTRCDRLIVESGVGGAENDFVLTTRGKYEAAILKVFENKREEGHTTDDAIPFESADIRSALDELGYWTRISDLVYAYSYRSDLPEEIGEYGYKAVISIGKSGSGDYYFTKNEQTINIPDPDETHFVDLDEVPDAVRKFTTANEQGSLTRARWLNLIDDFTGLDCYHLQGHMREGAKLEVDDFYIGVDTEGAFHAIIIEAKESHEELKRSQIVRNTRGTEERSEFPNSVVSLGLKTEEESFYLIEFNVEGHGEQATVEAAKTWQYVFDDSVQGGFDEYN